MREEILKKMDFCWKILTFETGGTSLVLGFVFVNGTYELLLLVPFLILFSSFLHLGEISAILNAGNYIYDRIEKDLKQILENDRKYESMSWEDWVDKHNISYKRIHISTTCLFSGMFVASIVLSLLFKDKMDIPLAFDWIFYLLLFGLLLVFVWYLLLWHKEVYKKC